MPLNSKGVSLKVASPNGTRNLTINDVIGNRLDGVDATTLFAKVYDLWFRIHAPQLVYPLLDDSIGVTSHADAWTLGSYKTIIPEGAIDKEFHIHHISIYDASQNGEYEIRLYAGTSNLAIVSFSRTDKKDAVEGIDLFTPHCAPGTRVRAKLASGNSASEDTVYIKLWYHIHT